MFIRARLSAVILLLSLSLISVGCASKSSIGAADTPSAKKSTKKKKRSNDDGYVGVQSGTHVDIYYKFDDERVTVVTQNKSDSYLSHLSIVIRQEVKLPKSVNRSAESISYSESQNGYDLLEPDKALLIDQVIPNNATGQVQVIVYASTLKGGSLINIYEEFKFHIQR